MSDTIEDRVARGAAILDEKRPGWFDEIKLDELRMSSCRRCMLGQIYGRYMLGLHLLCPFGGGPDVMDEDDPSIQFSEDHGFETSDEREEYDDLGVAWHAEVMKRRNGGES